MRTTVTLDDDVAAEVARLRRRRRIGVSEAVNELVRAGMSTKTTRAPFRQRTVEFDLLVNVDDVAEVLELLDDEPTA